MGKDAPLPPQNIDAEESLLGSLLIDPRAILDIVPLIRPTDFYVQKHRFIYEAILAQDIPVVLASTLLAAWLVVVGNLAADLAMAAVDPRIQLTAERSRA